MFIIRARYYPRWCPVRTSKEGKPTGHYFISEQLHDGSPRGVTNTCKECGLVARTPGYQAYSYLWGLREPEIEGQEAGQCAS